MNETFDYTVDEFSPRVKIVGLGGGGCRLVNGLCLDDLQNVEKIGINTDTRINELGNLKIKLVIDTYGDNGCGGNVDLAKSIAKSNADKIGGVLKNSDLTILVSYFGEGTGTGFMEEAIKIVRENNGLPLPLILLPLAGTGDRRVAEKEFKNIKNICNYAIGIDYEVILKKYGSIRMKDAQFLVFNRLNEIISEYTTTLLKHTQFGNLTVNDLSTIVTHSGDSAVIRSEGPIEDTDKLVKFAMEYSMVEEDIREKASGAWVLITVGDDVSQSNVDILRRAIVENVLKPEAYGLTDMFIGVRIDNKYKGSAKIFGMLTGLDSIYRPPDRSIMGYPGMIDFVSR